MIDCYTENHGGGTELHGVFCGVSVCNSMPLSVPKGKEFDQASPGPLLSRPLLGGIINSPHLGQYHGGAYPGGHPTGQAQGHAPTLNY